MDWNICCQEKKIKKIYPDKDMALSLKNTSKNKAISSERLALTKETAASKISLSYDSIREILESLSLKKGFKIYNHACYTAFLKEKLNKPMLGEEFDDLRKIRNDINYYGREISVQKAVEILERLKNLRKEIIKII